MVTFGVSTKSYQTATLNMVTLFFMIMTAFIEIIMPHLISTSYGYISYKKNKDDLKYRTYIYLQFLALLSSVGLRSIPLMERIYWMFSFPIIISFPYFLQGITKKELRTIMKWCVILVYTGYMFYDICALRDHDVIPYRWIFGKNAMHYSGWERLGGGLTWGK